LHAKTDVELAGQVGPGWQALAHRLHEYGIGEEFIRAVSLALPRNTSIVFVLVRRAQPDFVVKELSRFGRKVLRASLSREQEARLYAALCSIDTGSRTLGRAA
jgi:uncharacterized membrane protein